MRVRHIASLIFSLCTLAFAAQAWAQQPEQWKVLEDDWYVLEIAGSKAGWTHSLVETDGSHLRTSNETQMKISRGGMALEITMGSVFTETADGQPLKVEGTQKLATQVMQTTWEFTDKNVKVTTRQGGRETTSEQPLPEGQWLPPRAAHRFTKQQRESGAEQFTYRTIDPNSGLRLISVTSKRTGNESIALGDKQVEVTVWTSTTDLMPGIEAIERVDASNKMISQETTMPGIGKMVTRLSTRAEAQGDGAGGAELAPELLFQTFITPDKPIENPMKVTRARYRVTVKQGKLPPLPSAAAQRAEMADDGTSAIITVDINDNLPASQEDAENKDYIAASAMIDSSDELIQKLVARAAERSEDDAADVEDAWRRAESLRRLVRRHISKKGMQTAFASASETAKMRTGDCSEHGVLLAALLRADGIPARVATGLVYADAFAGHESIFGWHMWTQALIDGKWVDFDATLPVRYNAAHILTSTSSLKDGLGAADMASVVQLLGNLEVEVLEVTHSE